MVDLGKKPALIVIDMQNGFCHPEGSFAQLPAVGAGEDRLHEGPHTRFLLRAPLPAQPRGGREACVKEGHDPQDDDLDRDLQRDLLHDQAERDRDQEHRDEAAEAILALIQP